MEDVETILKTDYINVTELTYIIEELNLKYTRQALSALKRSNKPLFQYDAKAFGSYFFREAKV